jgi:membrane protein implicated in regulation of membrane protease activity
MIILITSSVLQFIILCVVTFMIYRRSRSFSARQQEDDERRALIASQRIRIAGTTPYILATLAIIILEELHRFVSIQSDEQTQYNSITFGQIFAVAATIAPIIEFIKYMFRKQEDPPLSNHSPFWHIIRATNFHNRKHIQFRLN